MIQNIEVAKLHFHPDNPRKNLGDLSELADSIKTRGVLQNLTVVPRGEAELKGHYIIVIGHRRLAASRLAGLKEVPCAISDMDYRTQIETMLLENMQREELTVYEQAQGFQQLLDFGESVEQISQKTGFSQTTVRRRVRLLELDQDKFKESEARNVTLLDYMRLEEIEGIELRNKVLEYAGTSNFEYELKKAIGEERKEKWLAQAVVKLKTFATEVDEHMHGHKYVASYYASREDEIVVPEDAGSKEYFFMVGQYGGIDLWGEARTEETNDAEILERERRKAKYMALDEIAERAYTLRQKFIQGIPNTKVDIKAVARHMTSFMEFSYVSVDPVEMTELLGLTLTDDEDEVVARLKEQADKHPEKYLLVIAYGAMDCAKWKYHSWQGLHTESESLDLIYEFLVDMGYELSDEELAWKNGTHELFESEE